MLIACFQQYNSNGILADAVQQKSILEFMNKNLGLRIQTLEFSCTLVALDYQAPSVL